MKQYDEEYKDLDNGLKAHCWTENTKQGFKHVAVINDKDYFEVARGTAHYLNRTWEAYRYETAIKNALIRLEGD